MKYQPHHYWAELQEALEKPAWRQPIVPDELLALLQTELARCDMNRDMHAAAATGLHWFTKFCQTRSGRLLLSEELFFAFDQWLEAVSQADRQASRFSRCAAGVRNLVNLAGKRLGLLDRPLIGGRAQGRLCRFLRLSPATREMLVWYEQHARKLKAESLQLVQPDGSHTFQTRYRLESQALAPYARANRIGRAVFFWNRSAKHAYLRLRRRICAAISLPTIAPATSGRRIWLSWPRYLPICTWPAGCRIILWSV